MPHAANVTDGHLCRSRRNNNQNNQNGIRRNISGPTSALTDFLAVSFGPRIRMRWVVTNTASRTTSQRLQFSIRPGSVVKLQLMLLLSKRLQTHPRPLPPTRTIHLMPTKQRSKRTMTTTTTTMTRKMTMTKTTTMVASPRRLGSGERPRQI